jgi:tetratricopeptide (TPR) repeat protein
MKRGVVAAAFLCSVLAQTNTVDEGARLLRDGKFKEAEALASKALADAPDDADLLFLQGSAECSLERYDAGIDHLLRAVHFGPPQYKFEYRAALENCIAAKHKEAPEAAKPKATTTAVDAAYPEGRSFTYAGTATCDMSTSPLSERDYRTVKATFAFSFKKNNIVEYAGSWRCNSGGGGYYSGYWRRVAKLLYLSFPDPKSQQSPWELTFSIDAPDKFPRLTGGKLPVFGW